MEDAADTVPNRSPDSLPRILLVLLDNLFLAAKINQASSAINIKPVYAQTTVQALDLARTINPTLVLIDLDATSCTPLEFVSQLKTDHNLWEIPIVGFVSQVNVGIQQRARDLGCDKSHNKVSPRPKSISPSQSDFLIGTGINFLQHGIINFTLVAGLTLFPARC